MIPDQTPQTGKPSVHEIRLGFRKKLSTLVVTAQRQRVRHLEKETAFRLNDSREPRETVRRRSVPVGRAGQSPDNVVDVRCFRRSGKVGRAD